MHFYQFNIGDYAAHTRHLSPMEDLAYRRLLDLAYTTELPLIKDIRQLSRLVNLRDYAQDIEDVLSEFWVEVDEGWIHNRVLKEIEKTGGKSEKAKQSANVRWEAVRKANAMRKSSERNANASKNDANASKNDATQDLIPKTQYTDKNIVIGKPTDDCPHNEIISLYHEILPTMPSIKIWTEKRKKILQARWREDGKRQSVEWWGRYFRYVATSDFLCGRTEKPFCCSLEWLINSSNMVKTIEGCYDNR